jgi:hypothetical protein
MAYSWISRARPVAQPTSSASEASRSDTAALDVIVMVSFPESDVGR